MKHYSLYTDGACSGNPGRGGWAAVAFNEEGDNIMQHSGGYRVTTNNRMEILAVANGLKDLAQAIINLESKDTDIKVTVYSDSQLVINTMNQGWSKKTNSDLWKELDDALESMKKDPKWNFSIEFVKVKGHADDPRNNFVDSIAVAASQPINANQADTYYEAIAKEAHLFDEVQKPDVPVIQEITLSGYDTADKRQVRVKLSNGTVVTILPCYGGFQQTGCTKAESEVTVGIAWKYVKWLNGKAL